MTTILQIETATTACSVALARDGEVIGLKQINQRNIHAEVITLFIDELLKSNAVNYADIDAIAVSSGPGSYTGLRIGVSTAKGLCYALDKPLIAVETLQAMADGVRTINSVDLPQGTLLCPMIDARRMEVYTAVFDGASNRLQATAALVIEERSFDDYLQHRPVLFFGDGAEKCRDVIGGNPNALFMPEFANSAAYLTNKAFEKLSSGDVEDVAYFEPYYLKDFIAGTKKV
ncbi:tRNA (adenosine(37)-N6)-threonylcarbamoyltransferase complex dimerization subunit type 1 TsaB [Mucilaginibacter hurinus]|uniref:tRNA (Adenosine(37)-N6)-threonylcarbamoyltransferase complex dimerization subunit type 1 TsaB n=1 Tax=Mucilaginibacter hurinus TaxID=2201324 RepID=A0A367GNU9_9SPHI|nr:tRNA (adenosine(37)-N6)-threonylcarbamoyltransferase complex dimerization subunit type 1 TsaB [Mucilaginibacter hurinus]RCH55172.1 tRNA (adenosine(37)-N6)-threonylcarbamoyltransferase complex dimerization subunit type 1 TsaB [Mucilaginibacter hurinus]